MKKTPQIQSNLYRKFSSGIKPIVIHLANFRYNHKDDPEKNDVYINRELLENKLESWLLSPDKSGSYLVAGYRGMGKTSLVNHVLGRVTRQCEPMIERLTLFSLLAIAFTAFLLSYGSLWWVPLSGIMALVSSFFVIYNYYKDSRRFLTSMEQFPHSAGFPKLKLNKILTQKDGRQKSYQRIKIKVNLGREVMNERDVLCLITNSIRIRYEEFLRTGQNKPIWLYVRTVICCIITVIAVNCIVEPLFASISNAAQFECSFFAKIWNCIVLIICGLRRHIITKFLGAALIFAICYICVSKLFNWFVSFYDQSEKCLRQLQNLSERLSSHVIEADGDLSLSNSMLYISLFSRRKRNYQIANIRDIETELTEIINTLNSKKCFRFNQVQFLIVLDELDKVEYRTDREEDKSKTPENTPPDFSTAIEGFSGSMTNSERRRTIMQLLANMKLFLTSARAKFIFISGRELYEAFLADISDREYAISSIFSGVINVNSFLQPEREQSDISSMTEQYVSEILLPKGYLWEKMEENARKNKVLKREIPSYRWYTQYLTESAEKKFKGEELMYIKEVIRHVVMFLYCFTVYLSHVSNGSPKKIMLYFEKYVKRYTDIVKLYDWDDTYEVGVPDQYALHFTSSDQQKIGFIFHRMAPIMDVILNNVSNYDDKLLISASFLVDHLFKFHGRGFSWPNIEQTPELLDVNKTSELRDFITSIIEFMQQNHLTSIMVGLFQFKFRRRISEEISHISRISDEAAAMFNFTLNETQAVKQHNLKLLAYYKALNGNVSGNNGRGLYNDIISRIHITLGDLYFLEEDYTRALQEYRSGLNYLDREISGTEDSSSIIARIRCMLKMGLTSEYCKTYETAYVIYCILVDSMISVREVKEQNLGLDIIDRYTEDWRIKLPMVINPGVRAADDERRIKRLKTLEQDSPYRKQIVYGVWDDGVYDYKADGKKVRKLKECEYAPAEYSLDFDHLVSGFSANLSPEKSHFIAHLSMFEDIRLIYKAILAKLFVLEKMNMSGITQSNIKVAEAEFKYLHRTINPKEKFFISADFFNQLGKILYYKNSLCLWHGIKIKGKNGEEAETLASALYWAGIDVYAYMDDFCFESAKSVQEDFRTRDAVLIKKEIEDFFNSYELRSAEGFTHKKSDRNVAGLLDYLSRSLRNRYLKNRMQRKRCKVNKQIPAGGNADYSIVRSYIDYIRGRMTRGEKIPFDRIIRCSKNRCAMRKEGWNLPCYACKYYNQSLAILMDEMFVLNREETMPENCSKSIFLLQFSFRRYLTNTRVNHLRLLAMNCVSMANTLYSCASDREISPETMELIREMLKDGKDKDKDRKKEELVNIYMKDNAEKMSRLDRVLLYYLAAYRFYNIIRQARDSGDCLFKIANLINEVITGFNFDKKTILRASPDKGLPKEILLWMEWRKLLTADSENNDENKNGILDLLFTRYEKSIGLQYGYNSIPELPDYRWSFHMSNVEDLNFTRLQTYSSLKEIIWVIADIRIKNYYMSDYFAKNDYCGKNIIRDEKNYNELKRKEVEIAYKHFQPLGKLRDTFYNEIVDRYARFRLNKLVLKDMFGKDPFVDPNDSHEYNQRRFQLAFLECLESYLKTTPDRQRLDSRIFKMQESPAERLNLIEFLLDDSIVCLTDITSILSPNNHMTSFTNSFIAQVYNQLWEYSKMYEILVELYNYRYNRDRMDVNEFFKLRYRDEEKEDLGKLKAIFNECCEYITEDKDLRERYGSLSSRFFMNLRHKIDDRTIHHVISNYAAEMAIRYYNLAEGTHSEGEAYRNKIARNYVLNDDLDDDIWLFNTAMERFRLHTRYIKNHKDRLVKIYQKTHFYKYDGYMLDGDLEPEFARLFDANRFEDSLNINSEL